MKKQNTASTIAFDQVFAQHMRDPEFAAEWHAQENQRKIMSMLIEERIKRKKSQKELAQEIGVKPSSLSRLESGTHTPSIAFLAKIADALGRRLEISLVPK